MGMGVGRQTEGPSDRRSALSSADVKPSTLVSRSGRPCNAVGGLDGRVGRADGAAVGAIAAAPSVLPWAQPSARTGCQKAPSRRCARRRARDGRRRNVGVASVPRWQALGERRRRAGHEVGDALVAATAMLGIAVGVGAGEGPLLGEGSARRRDGASARRGAGSAAS